MATLEEGQRALRRLVDRLGRPEGLEQAYAVALLEQAKTAADRKPTPQARMGASALGVQSGTILTLSGGAPAEVQAGSEFGSTIYRQFGPRNSRGYWLFPAVESPDAATIAAGEDWLDDQVEASIRGF